jgi:hypothetical protein
MQKLPAVKTHILIEMIKDNPFNDDTTADEKYQFTCMIDFCCVFRDRAILERINFRERYSVEIIVEKIIIYVEHIFKRFNCLYMHMYIRMPKINIYLECKSFLKLYTLEYLYCAFSQMSQWSIEINHGTNRQWFAQNIWSFSFLTVLSLIYQSVWKLGHFRYEVLFLSL